MCNLLGYAAYPMCNGLLNKYFASASIAIQIFIVLFPIFNSVWHFWAFNERIHTHFNNRQINANRTRARESIE